MSAEIFGTRFVSHRVPAWHRLGTVLENAVTAQEAFAIAGEYRVTLEPVTVAGVAVEGKAAIYRHATADDAARVFGIVSDHYHLLDPAALCRIWDEATGATVETLGALRHGRDLFISTHLPTIDVAGDAVETYLLASNPMSGRAAAVVRITPVRVVCANTLALSASRTVESFSIPHTREAEARMTRWLRHAYLGSVEKVAAVREAFTVLAEARATSAMMDTIAAAAYPMPERTMRRGMPERSAQREAMLVGAAEFATEARQRVAQLFDGAGTGMDTRAAAGTLWGAYNAVTEFENYRRHRGAGSSYDVIFGERAAAMERAFDASMALATGQEVIPAAFVAAFDD